MSDYKYIILAVFVWIALPLAAIGAISFFTESTPPASTTTYEDFFNDLEIGVVASIGGLPVFGDLFADVVNGVINFFQFFFNLISFGLIEFLFDKVFEVIAMIPFLTETIGIGSWVMFAIIGVYTIVPVLILVKHLPTT